MKGLLKKRPGFTMIELMAVVIILGVLAAAAAPIYRGNVKKAIRSEAIATLGAIRTAERVYKSENGVYLAVTEAAGLTTLGVDVEDAQFFDENCYTVDIALSGVSTFTATAANVSDNAAPGNTKADSYWTSPAKVASMDTAGTIAEDPA
jgi:prepilin-type N-terminal cleavage/methylation domain-containing protein